MTIGSVKSGGLIGSPIPILIYLNDCAGQTAQISQMRPPLTAANLGSSDIEPAFALIQALHPSLSLTTWRGFATALVDQTEATLGGLVGVRNEAGYLCGLFVYRVEADLRHDRAFVVDVIAALDIVDASTVIRTMMKAAQAEARRLACGIIRVRVGRSQVALARFLDQSGMKIEGEVLSIVTPHGDA